MIDEIKRENFCYDFYIAKTEDTPSTDFVFITDGGLVDSFYLFFTDDTGTVFRAYRLKLYVNHWYDFSIQDKNSTEISTFQKEEGTSVEITRNEFPHDDIPGYTFSHWFVTVNNDTGEETFEISQGESFVVKGNYTFEPVYTPNENTLHFDKNDDTATGEMEPVQMKTGEERNLPAVGFEKTGYHLKGWATSSDGEVVYADKSSFTMGTESECTLYAVWEANANTLHFDGNGETGGATKDMMIASNATATLIPNGFEKTGYHFIGWATSASGGVVYPDEGSYAMGTEAEYTLYAVWEITTYSITYELNGGQPVSENPTTFTVEELPIDLHNTYKKDYTFMGWYDNSGFEGNPLTSITEVGDIILYARFDYGTEGLIFTEEGEGYTLTEYTGKELEVVVPDEWLAKPVLKIAHGVFEDFDLTKLTIPFVGETLQGQKNSCFGYIFGAYLYSYNDRYVPDTLKTVIISEVATSIGEYAFQDCSSLNSVIFDKNSQLFSIGNYAFYGCSGLTSIEIPSSVTSIGRYAFSGCSSLTSIEIPSGVTSIGNSAFSGCSSLTSIEIPGGVTSIDYFTFSGCSSLTSIELPSSVTSIGQDAFFGCSSLTSIEIPSGVTSIDYSAFEYCSSLESIVVEEGNTEYKSENNCLIKIATNSLILGCKNSIIPSYVTSIGGCAFRGSGLTSIVIPSSVTSIGNGAFKDCSSLDIVYYVGASRSDWNDISIGNSNTYLTSATLYYYSDNPPLNEDGTYDGNYWCYVDGVPTIWVKEQ